MRAGWLAIYMAGASPYIWIALSLGCCMACASQKRKRATSDSMASQFLGKGLRRWIEYLIAILVGTAIYYVSLVPHLPEVLRHQGFQVDLGTIVDFAVCAAVYGLIRLGSRL